MRIKALIFLVLCLFTACKRDIVLRVDPVETIPFSSDIETGDYELTFYKLTYPKDLLKKEKFYRELNILVKKLFVKDKKRDVIISEEFYSDYTTISAGKFLLEEEMFEKVASNLDSEEQAKLKEITSLEILKFSNTVQEYLNLQVFHLLKSLGREDEFEREKIYTEREKNNIILDIKNERKETAKIINQMDLNLIIQISTPYEEKSSLKYWDDADIELNEDVSNIRADLSSYKQPIYIDNLKERELEKIFIGKQIFLNKVVILENEKFSGYLYDANKRNFTFLTNGKIERSRFPDYNIKIEVKEVEFADLISLDEEYILTDFIGGK